MRTLAAVAIGLLILIGCAATADGDAEVLALVREYGADIGGRETIESLLELSLRDLKPQSTRGIEIYGWHLERTESSGYKVSYTYLENGRSLTILSWIVDVDSKHIRPVNDLSERMMQMASLL